jgi:hypothetical protein
MVRGFAIVSLGTALSLGIVSVDARGAGSCDSALVMSTYNSKTNVGSDWRLADIVSQDTYDQIKHDAGANAVIYGIPVGASYSDFHNHVDQMRKSYSESLSYSQKVNIAWTGLDPNSSSVYHDCITKEILSSVGLHAAVLSATETDITVLVRWNLPGNAAALNVKWVSSNSRDPSMAAFPSKIAQGDTTVIVKRPTTEFSIAGNAKGYSTYQIVLDPLPTSPPAVDPAAPTYANGWYGFSNAPNLDRERELHNIEPAFTRIHAVGTFDTLCITIGKSCAKVVDFQKNNKACNENPNDGSRLAYCQ